MFEVDEETNHIYINRGDRGALDFSVDKEDGTPYTFKVGDVVRFTVKNKYFDKEPLLRKDVEVNEETEVVRIEFSKEDTTIGDLINKPKKYVYDIAINEDITVIGYDKDTGKKLFIVYPEASNDE